MASAIRNNTELNRFELEAEGKTAFVQYAPFPGGVEFLHTLVPPELEGKGIGSALAKHVFAEAEAQGWETVVTCPFLKQWKERH